MLLTNVELKVKVSMASPKEVIRIDFPPSLPFTKETKGPNFSLFFFRRWDHNSDATSPVPLGLLFRRCPGQIKGSNYLTGRDRD